MAEKIITKEMWEKAANQCALQGVHLAELIEDEIDNFDVLYETISGLVADSDSASVTGA